MKKIMLFVAIAIMLAVAAPVMAGPYSDVPETHWAYQALEKLAPTGIMGGYPDGTFQGNNTLNRFQVAVIVAKILDQVAAEKALMAERVDALENGLTAGQAEDTIAIFKSLLAKIEQQKAAEQPAPATAPAVEPAPAPAPVVEVKVPENLTATQAEEVAAIVEALALEFKFELEAMGAKLDALGTTVTGIDTRVAALEKNKVSFTGSYTATVNRTIIDGNVANAYLDPYKFDFDADDDVDSSDKYAVKNTLEHKLALGLNVKTANLLANMNLIAVKDNFADVTPAGMTVDTLSGTISGDDFKATIGRDQTLVMTSFLFGKNDPDNDLYNGITLNVGKDAYALFKNYDDSGEVVVNENIFATQKALGLLNSTLYVGVKDIINSGNFVAGIVSPADLLTIDLTTTGAVEKAGEDYLKYFTINAKKSLGALNLQGNYTLRDDGFAGYYSKGLKQPGYDAKADMTLFSKLSVNGRYADYTDTTKLYDNQYGFGANLDLGKLTGNFDMDFAKNDPNESNRTQAGVQFATDIAFLNVSTGYTYDKVVDGIGGIYVDDDDVALDSYNRAYGDLTAKLFGGLTATANYVYGIADLDVEGKGLTTHKYGLTFAKGILSAGANYNMISGKIGANATINPAAYNVLGFGIDTIAGFKMSKAKAADALFNYNVGVDVTRALNAKSNLTYGFVYDNREIAATEALTGKELKHTVKVDYKLATDLSANVQYTNLNFTATADADSYHVQQVKTGLTLKF